MKNFRYVLCSVMAMVVASLAASQTVTFTYTASTDTSWVRLDHIRVVNLSRSGDTTLFYPDTVLVLPVSVGLDEKDGGDPTFGIISCKPGPGGSNYMISVNIPDGGLLIINLSDLQGRLLVNDKFPVHKGLHTFTLKGSTTGIYIFNAIWKNRTDSRKIILMKGDGSSSWDLERNEISDAEVKTPGLPSAGFQFVPGDVIWNRGYSGTTEAGLLDRPTTSTGYTFHFAPPPPCTGLPSFVYGGQTYHTVMIGDRCWMKENLNIGSRIDGSVDQTNNSILEKYCYENDPANCGIYGGIYQWDEAMQYVTSEGAQGICPTGWHIPSGEEFSSLESFLGGMAIAGGKMKEAGTVLWFDPNTGATNESGLTVLPAGNFDPSGRSFNNLQYGGVLWSSTLTSLPNYAVTRGMSYNESKTSDNFFTRNTGYSVRCIKD